jgi:ribosome biogenesis GTPase A
MPPKKNSIFDAAAELPRFGRVKKNLKMGIVGKRYCRLSYPSLTPACASPNVCGAGLPNVGKSSLFNLLGESAEAAAENFPFW